MKHSNWQKLSIQSVFKVYPKWADLIAYLLQMNIDEIASEIIDDYEVIYPLTMDDPICEEFLRSEKFIEGSWVNWIIIKKDIISLGVHDEKEDEIYEADLDREKLHWLG
jgi:hypothetical protein